MINILVKSILFLNKALIYFKIIKTSVSETSRDTLAPVSLIKNTKESKEYKLRFIKAISDAENEKAQAYISDDVKDEIVNIIINSLPSRVNNGVLKGEKEIYITHSYLIGKYLVTVLNKDPEIIFKLIFPLLIHKLNELEIPYKLSNSLIYLDVNELKKYSGFNKIKNLC